MKKKKVIEYTVCDFCEERASFKCSCCGKDVCTECARWICKKYRAPQSGGPSVRFPSFFGEGDAYCPYPYKWKEEKTLCKDCTEKFKVAIGVLAGNED